ncbi:biotin synthase, partial [Vibrio parahaemolyticus]|nr:biotin synthase [Vibrio parahaemolyticus]
FKNLGINSKEVSQKTDEIEENELLDSVVERVAARPTKDDLVYDASV